MVIPDLPLLKGVTGFTSLSPEFVAKLGELVNLQIPNKNDRSWTGHLRTQLGWDRIWLLSYRTKLRTFHVLQTTTKLLDFRPSQDGLVGCKGGYAIGDAQQQIWSGVDRRGVVVRVGSHQKREALCFTMQFLWKACLFFMNALEQAVSASHSLLQSQPTQAWKTLDHNH